MTSQPEVTTAVIAEPALTELDQHERANAPTLRDLRKAAQDLALAGAFTDQPIKTIQAECPRKDGMSVR